MIKTQKEIEDDIYQSIKSSELINIISGYVYKNGMRPRDSKLEDIIVIATTGIPTQIQEGVITINIYVNDIIPYDNGIYVENGTRIQTLQRAAQNWVENMQLEGYKFVLKQTIHSVQDVNINQHFIVVKLAYKYFND